MAVCALSRIFRRLHNIHKETVSVSYSTQEFVSKSTNLTPISLCQLKKILDNEKPCYPFTARSLNLNLNIPKGKLPLHKIIENPILPILQIEEPLKNISDKIDIVPDKIIETPSSQIVIEKQAKIHSKNLILIRRRKMKKHKRRKFLKRMKFVIRKRKQRKQLAKEKLFQAELQATYKAAQDFDAKEYVAERIRLLTTTRLPNRYRGELLPEAMIKEFLQKRKEKREHKHRLRTYRLKVD